MVEDLSSALLNDLRLLADRWPELLLLVASALFCGFLLGYERQRKAKPVGILTALLVALGS